jgi:hypothetical protein
LSLPWGRRVELRTQNSGMEPVHPDLFVGGLLRNLRHRCDAMQHRMNLDVL